MYHNYKEINWDGYAFFFTQNAPLRKPGFIRFRQLIKTVLVNFLRMLQLKICITLNNTKFSREERNVYLFLSASTATNNFTRRLRSFTGSPRSFARSHRTFIRNPGVSLGVPEFYPEFLKFLFVFPCKFFWFHVIRVLINYLVFINENMSSISMVTYNGLEICGFLLRSNVILIQVYNNTNVIFMSHNNQLYVGKWDIHTNKSAL